MDADAEVARLLLEDWDPIGVADLDYAPHHEYLAEAQQVVAQLRRFADVDTVAAVLSDARLGSDRRDDRRAAAEVVSWWEANRQGDP